MGKNRNAFAQRKMGGGRLLGKRLFLIAGCALAESGLISFLFYDSPFGMCSLPFTAYVTFAYFKRKQRKKKTARLNLEFKDYMYAVSGALLAGNSIERAFLSGLKEIKQFYGRDSLLITSLGGMEKRLQMQEPIERILSDFAAESSSEDIESFVEIFCYAKRGGGDFVHILSTSVQRICDKMEVGEEIRSVMAEKALEQKVMSVAPLGILLFFRVTLPEFIGRLYGTLFGAVIMTIALFLYGASFFLGMKIVDIEV